MQNNTNTNKKQCKYKCKKIQIQIQFHTELYNYPVIAFKSSNFPLLALGARFSKRFLPKVGARVFMAWQNFTTTAKL